MAVNDDITFVFSNGASRSDPENSLGLAATANAVHEIEDAFTSNAAAGDIKVFDTSRTGDGDDAHNDKFLMIVTSVAANELFVSRIVDFVDSTGEFTLEQALPDAVTIGDVYRIFTGNDLYDDLTAQECADGNTKYRAIYAVQDSGATINDFWGYVIPLDPGPLDYEINVDQAVDSLPLVADEDTAPAVGALYAGDRFSRPLDFSQAEFEQPSRAIGTGSSWGTGQGVGMFVRQILPSNSITKARTLALLVVEATSVTPAQQVRAACLVSLQLDGFTPLVTLARDRLVRVKGGARYTANVTALETGLLVPEIPIGWTIDPNTGFGSLTTPESPETDANGKAGATYTAPTNPALESVVEGEALNTAGFPATSTVANVPITTDLVLRITDDVGAQLVEGTDFTVVRSTGVITWLGTHPNAESGYLIDYSYGPVTVGVRV